MWDGRDQAGRDLSSGIYFARLVSPEYSKTMKMLLLKSADATTVQAGFEIWEVKGETVRPLDIVEDALIMALPLSAVHESRDLCGPLAGKVADDNKETVRPFAELRSQMNKLNG